jgi:hypothetical protein
VALFFRNDIVKLELFGEQHPIRRKTVPPPASDGNGANAPPPVESPAFAASR